MGRAHATSGAAVGVVTSAAAPLVGAPAPVWAAAVVAASILPDVDHPGATLPRMWGAFSQVPTRLVSPLLGGHRGATHHWLAWLGAAVLVAAASTHPVASAVVFAFLTGAAIAAAGTITVRVVWPVNLAASTAVGYLAWAGGWPLMPLAAPVALGVAVHLAGDRIPVKSTRERLAVAGSYLAVTAWVFWPHLIALTGHLLQGVTA